MQDKRKVGHSSTFTLAIASSAKERDSRPERARCASAVGRRLLGGRSLQSATELRPRSDGKRGGSWFDSAVFAVSTGVGE
jgi:hypothetical protein